MIKRTTVKKNHFSIHYIGILLVPLLLTLFIVFVLATQIQQQFDSRSSASIIGGFCPRATLLKTSFQYSCSGGYKVVNYVCSNEVKGVYGSSSSSSPCLTKAQLTLRATKICQSSNTCNSPSPRLTPQPSFPPDYTPPPSPSSPRPTSTSFPPPTSTPKITSIPTPTPTAYPLRTPTPTPKATGAPSTPIPPPTSTPKPF